MEVFLVLWSNQYYEEKISQWDKKYKEKCIKSYNALFMLCRVLRKSRIISRQCEPGFHFFRDQQQAFEDQVDEFSSPKCVDWYLSRGACWGHTQFSHPGLLLTSGAPVILCTTPPQASGESPSASLDCILRRLELYQLYPEMPLFQLNSF